ncbi:RluA family pseudouridine synthase [Salipaludibacillus sp. LMS25]|jgi:23S rRNA pseudouridine1911/1915/1917 synthase|uniref:RluA family pseudouridine synthase n=1 Tax=Salipaludibacillus sp. LMS25 TaxID=2924031 RepID=UPI0020D1D44B|nr:RluA family pseudouridine synthase [Salipaludibacillus sp. LMS25]
MTLKAFLREEKHLSRKLLAEIKFQGGSLFINGREVTVREKVFEGDHIEVVLPPERISEKIKKTNLALQVIYEDDHLLVINKPANLVTIPTHDSHEPSLAGAVLQHYENNGWRATFHAVNRLDRDTTGLVIIAKHRYAHEKLAMQQRSGKLEREYKAVVHGLVPWQFGSIHARIARKPTSIIERSVSAKGQQAVTHFETVDATHRYSILTLRLETGRTHQIRVHMAWLGYPLVGDTLYGSPSSDHERMMLHSYKAVFYHPFTGEQRCFSAPLPSIYGSLFTRT